MLFVTLMKAKTNSTFRGRMPRRLEWRFPEGMKVIGEYWLPGNDPTVVVISEGENPEVIFQAVSQWDDLFDFTVSPAVTAEEGIAMARRELAAARA